MRNMNLRVPDGVLERADALIESIQENPDVSAVGPVSRASVLRLALLRGLNALETEQGKKQKAATRGAGRPMKTPGLHPS